MMTAAARLFFWGYTLALLGVGASGIFIATWELPTLVGLNLDTLNQETRATMLHQYRFLKSTEFALGAVYLCFRHDIFRPSAVHKLFLVGVLLGAAARFGSMAVDGRPNGLFIAFAVFELVTGALVWAAVRRDRSLTA